MSPVDFGSGSPASVDLGYGAHYPQIRFTADDESCMWNGFPVCLGWDLELFTPIVPVDPVPTSQLLIFTAPPGAGAYQPTESEWPHMRVYDAHLAALSGYDLQFKMRFFATGSTSCGSACIARVGSTCCGDSQPGPIFGEYIESVFSPTGNCVVCTSDDEIELALRVTNFSPITANGVTIGAAGEIMGRIEAQWVSTGDPPPSYAPDQQFKIEFRPPCYIASGPGDLDAGLYIALETDSCGNLTKTFTNVRDAVNALGLGITASVLGGHGADIAEPDPHCTPPEYCCDMTGADCSGGVDWPYTG
ncbi:MAG TPA: hypothetical protein VGF24_37305 [Vicinamibacterales bacterium]|jgi:hypothetical protein